MKSKPSTYLVFDDEFRALSLRPAGAATGIWNTELWWGPNTIINGESQYYVDTADDGTSLSGGVNPFSIQNGILSITATPAPAGTSNGQQFDSGVLTSEFSFSRTYGYFEVNAEMPAGAGTAPAFWLLSSSHQWPPELDVVEEIGQQPTSIVGTVHTGAANTAIRSFLTTPDVTAGFHTYGVDWQAKTITWYFDGKAYGSCPTPQDMHSPMFMVLNLAIGGGWPGSPPNPSQLDAGFKIDYVRVWNQFPGAALASPTSSMTFTSASTSIATSTLSAQPMPTPVSTPTATTAPPDTLTLYTSEDAYEGDARFTVSVNGDQVGGTMTASTLRPTGNSNVFTLTGNWGANATVKIQFINDAYGGTLATDRNLYINAIGYDGDTYVGAAFYTNTTSTFQMGRQAPTAAVPADTLTLHLSEDYYLDDADFELTVDGRQVTTPQPVTALHHTGAWEDFTIAGNFGAATHTIGVTFINDAYGGTASSDRNLYVSGIDLNGAHYGTSTSVLAHTGDTANYAVTTKI